MTEYILLIPTDEKAWAEATPEDREVVYARHREFSEALAARGHAITKAAELAPSTEALVVTGDRTEVTVTEGPYAEAAEQLSGFYVIETDDRDDLVRCIGILAEEERGLELRRCGG